MCREDFTLCKESTWGPQVCLETSFPQRWVRWAGAELAGERRRGSDLAAGGGARERAGTPRRGKKQPTTKLQFSKGDFYVRNKMPMDVAAF